MMPPDDRPRKKEDRWATNAVFMMMPPDDRPRKKEDRWATALGTAQPFRCDASSPIDQCSDIAPRTSRTVYNARPCIKFRLFAAARVTAMALFAL